MYFESAQDKEYRYNLAKEGKLPSWYWYHKRLSIVKFIKDVSCILSDNFKREVLDNINSFSLVDVYKSIVKFLKKCYGDIFDGKIDINNDLGKTENDKQNSAFEHCRDKRNKTDNKTLDNYRMNNVAITTV